MTTVFITLLAPIGVGYWAQHRGTIVCDGREYDVQALFSQDGTARLTLLHQGIIAAGANLSKRPDSDVWDGTIWPAGPWNCELRCEAGGALELAMQRHPDWLAEADDPNAANRLRSG